MIKLDMLKKCLQDLIDYEDNDAAMKMLAKHHLEGERPTKFFCSMMKKIKNNVQFCSLVKTMVNVTGEEVK